MNGDSEIFLRDNSDIDYRQDYTIEYREDRFNPEVYASFEELEEALESWKELAEENFEI